MASGHFSGKFFSKIAGSGPDGSNDTILEFVSCPGAEPIECQTHTHTHTEYGYYNIDFVLWFINHLIRFASILFSLVWKWLFFDL